MHETPPDANIWELAVPYARAGLHVFPVNMTPDDQGRPLKTPFPRYLWKERASNHVNHVIEDFVEAQHLIVDYQHVGVAWALGIDRFIGLDLDAPNPPPWWRLLPPTLVNKTPRGEHLIYQMPPDRIVGNSTARFPTQGWGELRGAGGYIVIRAWDRPGLALPLPDIIPTFPHPDWLTDAGASVRQVSGPAAVAWVEAHATPTDASVSQQKLKGYAKRLAGWESSRSRHETATEVACWMAREAAAGLVDAREAFTLLGVWWNRHASDPGRKRVVSSRELDSIARFAIGAALAEPERIVALRASVFDDASDDESDPGAASGQSGTNNERRSSFLTFHSTAPGSKPTVAADLGMMDDGRWLFHLARVNMIHGDSVAGKSWLVMFLIAECVRNSTPVVLLDYEDVAEVTGSRLRQIGVSQQALDDWLHVAHPDEPTTQAGLTRLVVDGYQALGVRHVFMDSLGEALGVEALEENSDRDVSGWLARLIRPLNRVGIGVTLVDHLTKAADNPLHPSGTKRKRAAITGTDWYLSSTEPFTLIDGGRALLRSAKDRHGQFRRGDDVAELVMGPLDLTNGQTTLDLLALAPVPKAPGFRVDLMVVAVSICEARPNVVHSRTSIRGEARLAGHAFHNSRMDEALEAAVTRGFLAHDRGYNGATAYRFVRAVPTGYQP